MSVYTNLSTKEVSLLLSKYSIGTLKSFQGISDGITNTNYFLNTSKGKYIITIFEDITCLLYTSPSPQDRTRSRMPSSA